MSEKLNILIGVSVFDWRYYAKDLEKQLNICRQARDHAVVMEESMRMRLNEARAELEKVNVQLTAIQLAVADGTQSLMKQRDELRAKLAARDQALKNEEHRVSGFIDDNQKLRNEISKANEAMDYDFKTIQKLKSEIERLNKQCEGLAQSALNNGQALILAEWDAEQLAKELKNELLGEYGFNGYVESSQALKYHKELTKQK